MKRACLLFLLTLAAPLASAEDFTLADGRVLRDAVVLRQTEEEIQVRHAEGIQKLRYTQLTRPLQERFNMTPEQVESRREEAKRAAAEKRESRRAAEAERQAQLASAGTQPRFLAGADVLTLLSPLDTVTAAEAEYLAAEWNRREAQRLNLPESARSYAELAASLHGAFSAEREQFLNEYRRLQQANTTISSQQEQIKTQQETLDRLKAENKRLASENKDLWRSSRSSTNTTTIISTPRPYFIPRPIIRPAPARPAIRTGGSPGGARPAVKR